MRFTKSMEARSQADLLQHLEEAPFAWLFSAGGETLQATPLPLLADTDSSGTVTSLTGHMARVNPHVELLRTHPRALITFLGPNSYISPSWCRDRKQAPSWNYVLSQFVVDVQLFEDDDFTHEALRRLVECMEHARPDRWSMAELEERYDLLRRAIIGFRAHVVSANSRFKLGQNEKPDVFDDQVAALGANGDTALARWMQRYRPASARRR